MVMETSFPFDPLRVKQSNSFSTESLQKPLVRRNRKELKRASHRSRYRQRRRFIAVYVSVPFNVKRNTLTCAFTPISNVAQADLLILVVVIGPVVVYFI